MITVLDFGGQYAHLIAQKVRKLGAYSEICSPTTPASELKKSSGIILSGGPQSVYEKGSPHADPALLELGIPVLGICYGWQWMAHVLGGRVEPQQKGEYGAVQIHQCSFIPFLPPDPTFTVWMSHGDSVTKLPQGFIELAASPNCPHAAAGNFSRKLYGVQFHPEVTHTEHGEKILRRFVTICQPPKWSVGDLLPQIQTYIKTHAANKKVFMFVSGGVDSVVAFTLLNQELGSDRVMGMLIDTGLMRLDEILNIQQSLAQLGITNLRVENARELFVGRLGDAYDPEVKRHIIGEAFVEVHNRVSARLGLLENEWLLGQGTIYPDRIESGATAHADRIKTHHNRVDGIKKLIDQGRVIEPLRDLYKDEVRKLGELIGLPHEAVWRHPFPGPALAIRILCSKERGVSVQTRGSLQPYVPIPVQSVGVQGDKRTYRGAVSFFGPGQGEVLEEVWNQAPSIPNCNEDISRVLCCLSHSQAPRFHLRPAFVTLETVRILQEADFLVEEVLRKRNLYTSVWQFPVVLIPIGCRPRTFSIVLRPVHSEDGMTAAASRLPAAALEEMTELILGIPEISMVFLDLTSKPPGTIEWE